MAILQTVGAAPVTTVLAANTWTEIQLLGDRPVEVQVDAAALLDVQYAYGIGDSAVLTRGLAISGTVAITPPRIGGKLAIRSTAGGSVTTSAV